MKYFSWIRLTLIAVCGAIACTGAVSQTLTIRLLNAKSAKPMKKLHVTITWDIIAKSFQVSVDKDGTAHIEVPPGAKQFVMVAGPQVGKEPERIAYINCNDPNTILFSVSDVIGTGVVPGNSCSSRTMPRRPGEIIFWALPKPWLDFQ
jgi:hypothetical protein